MKRLDLHGHVVARFGPQLRTCSSRVHEAQPGRPANGYDRARSPHARESALPPRRGRSRHRAVHRDERVRAICSSTLTGGACAVRTSRRARSARGRRRSRRGTHIAVVATARRVTRGASHSGTTRQIDSLNREWCARGAAYGRRREPSASWRRPSIAQPHAPRLCVSHASANRRLSSSSIRSRRTEAGGTASAHRT